MPVVDPMRLEFSLGWSISPAQTVAPIVDLIRLLAYQCSWPRKGIPLKDDEEDCGA
jgi:hypothetical protein